MVAALARLEGGAEYQGWLALLTLELKHLKNNEMLPSGKECIRVPESAHI